MITNKHKDFAVALVALAREHGMDRIEATFGNSTTLPGSEWPPQMVTASWREGRHGASKNISLSAQATVHEREQIKL